MEHKSTRFNFRDVNFYSKLISDYLSGELKTKGLVNWDYSLEQLNENKTRAYNSSTREIVHKSLLNQYSSFELSKKEKENLDLFAQENTSTITTGHQLMLLGGPMFFYTKILDVVKLCKRVSSPDSPVFPVFWMASEDHDYEEISKVNLFGKTLSCPGENKGPVGRIGKTYFNKFLDEVSEVLGDSEQYADIKNIIINAFSEGENLSSITRIFVRELFKDEGVLIIDGDDPILKQLFVPFAKQELENELAFNASKNHIERLSKDYKVQVTPREINLFYIEDDLRKRIVKDSDGFKTPDDELSWTKSELDDLLAFNPEKISPNVIMRPVYQEVLLPNLAYVGGAGEIAYWLELKPVFEAFDVPFPTPIVRTPYFVVPSKSEQWLIDNKIELIDLFGDIDVLSNRITKELAGEDTSLDNEIEELKSFFSALLDKSKKISPQLDKVVLGEEKRAISAIQNVEKRFLKAEKQKHEQVLNKLRNIQGKLFPDKKPMERVNSFIPFISNSKMTFKYQIMEASGVFDKEVVVLKS